MGTLKGTFTLRTLRECAGTFFFDPDAAGAAAVSAVCIYYVVIGGRFIGWHFIVKHKIKQFRSDEAKMYNRRKSRAVILGSEQAQHMYLRNVLVIPISLTIMA